jgi:His-Xaa-Ser system protein HxsD
MDNSTIWLDRSLFSEEVIVRAAHRYTNFFHATIRANGGEIGVTLTAREGVDRPADLEARFRDDVLDERLRELVRQETQGVHAELLHAALREARSPRSEPER